MISTERNQNGRIALGALLATFVAVSLATMVIPNTLGANWASAQSSPSPSPSGPVIQFLNPSGATSTASTAGPGREVSGRQDTDTAYHLVAWVANMPANATVEFKYVSGQTDVLIATATQRGADTFEAFWQASNFPSDGTYTLRAILYSNNFEVSRDNEQVVVNNQDAEDNAATGLPTSENQGQTVEITYPTNTGNFGLYRKPGTSTPHHGVIDVVASTGTDRVRAYYTTSRPGTEPQWVRCSATDTGETFTDAANGVRCTLAEGTDPLTVTAVSAAAGDANQTSTPPSPTCSPEASCGEGPDSGDAHRVSPYIQIPTSMTVNPQTQSQGDQDTTTAGNQYRCSDPITATLVDQVARKVAGANVDVHASGPTDNLHFDDTDTTGDQTSPHQPPDRGGHTTEATVDCESTASSASPRPFVTSSPQAQGEHESAGEGDLKHIETQPQGTDDGGSFKFALNNRSTTITGVTQFTAFYDRDDDDQLCSEEVRAHGSIGWSADPGTPTGAATDETNNCPEPTGSPSGSPSPTPTQSGSPSPTPTSTASPSPSPTGGQPPPECNDGADNDGDGRTDYPDDPGCDSANDNDETDPNTPQQEYGGTRGEPVTSGPCEGYTTGSTQQNPNGSGLVIVGTSGADTLQGSEEGDLICGLGGADTINGYGGGDTIYGHGGKDSIDGGDGNDEIYGNNGKDVILGRDGVDVIRGGNQNDNISGGAGNDRLLGQGGWDTLKGNAGDDVFVGHGGNDIIQGGGGDDVARGKGGDDVLKGFSGNDNLIGGKGSDILRGSAGNDFLKGGPGDDVLNGGADNDTCRGGGGSNVIRRCEN